MTEDVPYGTQSRCTSPERHHKQLRALIAIGANVEMVVTRSPTSGGIFMEERAAMMGRG